MLMGAVLDIPIRLLHYKNVSIVIWKSGVISFFILSAPHSTSGEYNQPTLRVNNAMKAERAGNLS